MMMSSRKIKRQLKLILNIHLIYKKKMSLKKKKIITKKWILICIKSKVKLTYLDKRMDKISLKGIIIISIQNLRWSYKSDKIICTLQGRHCWNLHFKLIKTTTQMVQISYSKKIQTVDNLDNMEIAISEINRRNNNSKNHLIIIPEINKNSKFISIL